MDTETSSLLSCLTVAGPTALAVAVLFSLTWFVTHTTLRGERDLRKAQDNYRDALHALENAPADVALRQEVLHCEREYARRLRSSGLETGPDEKIPNIDLFETTGQPSNGQ